MSFSSGLASAMRLGAKGWRVTVIDRLDRVGGRGSSITQGGHRFDLGPTIVTVPQLVPIEWSIQVSGSRVPLLNLFVIASSVALMFALQLFISRTRTGRAMRTTSMDRDASSLMGVNINRTIMITFLIGSGLAGAAGVVHGLYYGNTSFALGFQSGLKAFTAAVLGGIGNTAGAALGGFLIAFIEVGASAFGYGRWGGAVVFSLLVIFLVDIDLPNVMGRVIHDVFDCKHCRVHRMVLVVVAMHAVSTDGTHVRSAFVNPLSKFLNIGLVPLVVERIGLRDAHDIASLDPTGLNESN